MPSIACSLRRIPTALLGASLIAACSHNPVQPTDPGAPKIACPIAPPPSAATDLSGAIVIYGAAIVTLGAAPLTGPTCTPASGSRFPVGSTVVTCTVTDVKARTDSCAFNAVVQSLPKLTLTRFFAFGDSLTAGEVVSEGNGLLHGLRIDLSVAYPTDLQRDLDIRYQTQQPYVFNAGVKGESTADGVRRLANALSAVPQTQVVLFLEGANDLNGGNPATVAPAVLNMDTMVRTAKARGLGVMVGTLPPQNPNACTGSAAFPGCISRSSGAALVVPYNNGLQEIAAVESVALVDVYQAFNGDVTTLIDVDGLHPTGQGYQVMADAFFSVIRQTLEVAPTTTALPTLAPNVFLRPPRRR